MVGVTAPPTIQLNDLNQIQFSFSYPVFGLTLSIMIFKAHKTHMNKVNIHNYIMCHITQTVIMYDGWALKHFPESRLIVLSDKKVYSTPVSKDLFKLRCCDHANTGFHLTFDLIDLFPTARDVFNTFLSTSLNLGQLGRCSQ